MEDRVARLEELLDLLEEAEIRLVLGVENSRKHFSSAAENLDQSRRILLTSVEAPSLGASKDTIRGRKEGKGNRKGTVERIKRSSLTSLRNFWVALSTSAKASWKDSRRSLERRRAT